MDMKGRIKFHSIYYRYPLFIILLVIAGAKFISNGKDISMTYFGDVLTIGQDQLTYITIGLTLAIVVIFSIVGYKIYISQEGIYLRKIDLMVDWSEVEGLSHVWINEFRSRTGNANFYNRKTLVIYRKDYKPICVYNISLLSLFVAKLYSPKIKTNIVFASLATMINVGLNGWVFYQLFFAGLESMSIGIFFSWMGLFFLKILILPVIMTSLENRTHGDNLFHDTAYEKNRSKVVHL